MKKIKIAVGDYSGDGHSHCDYISLMCNRSVSQLEDLYKKSCALTGLQFTTNGDASGKDRDWQEMSKWKVLQEYEENEISEFQKEQFEKWGIQIPDVNFEDKSEEFTNLFLNFLKLSDKELDWDILEEEEDKDVLKLFIGYGIFGE